MQLEPNFGALREASLLSEANARPDREQQRPVGRVLRWLLLLLLLPLLLFTCGSLAMLQTGTAFADTRSILKADYRPWEFTTIRPVAPEIVQEVLRDQQNYPNTFAEPIAPEVAAGDFWSPPTTPELAAPTATPATVTPTATDTETPTLAASATATVTSTASLTPTASPSPTPPGPPPPVPPANPPANTYWFYDDTTPVSHMMYSTVPSGSGQSSGAPSFNSPSFSAGQALQAGTTTVNFYAWNPGPLNAVFTVQLSAGGSTLGTGTFTLPADTWDAYFFSASFATAGHSFVNGERLRVSFSLAAPAEIFWDGAYKWSGIQVPSISTTPTPTASPTSTPTATATDTPGPTNTPPPPTATPTNTPLPTATPTDTPLPTPTPTDTPLPTATPTDTPLPTPTPTNTPLPTATPTDTPLPTPTPTDTPLPTPTPTDTPLPTATPTATPTNTPAPASANYRSIGIDSSSLYAFGTASITSGSTVVTFGSGASLPSNVGVGDRLVIGAEVFFILSRDSTTQVTVQAPAASTHTDQGFDIRRAYNTLQDWETDRQGDLVAENRREVGVIYNDGTLTTGLVIDGSITDASRYMELTVAVGARHSGTAGTGAVLDGQDTNLNNLQIRDDYTHLEWLELTRHRGSSGYASVLVRAANVSINHLLVYDFDDPSFNVRGITVSGSGGNSMTVRNSIIFDGDVSGVQGDEATDTVIVENVTIYGMTGDGIDEDFSVLTIRNVISMGNGNMDFNAPNSSIAYSMSEDATSNCGTCLSGLLPADQFVSLTSGSEDLHLKAGADAIDVATDLSGSFSDDIDGDSRPQGVAWDMGADEYVAPPATATPTPTNTPTPTATDTPLPTNTPTPTPTPTSSGPAPSVDSVSTVTAAASGMTISHTTAGIDNRLMLVGVSINNDGLETVSSVTYGGQALSLVGTAQQADDSRVEIWSLVAPPTGTHDVVITFNTTLSRHATAGVVTFGGVDQTTPLGTFVSASGSSAGPATVDVSSATNELVFDTVACEACGSLTVGAGQTERWNRSAGNGGIYGAASTEPGAATVTMSWTLGAANQWAIGAVPINPSGGVPPAVDAVSNDTTAVSSMTVSHTTSGSDRLMLVGVSFNPNAGETVSSVTYNGIALTFVGAATWSNDARAEIWQLVSPDVGTYDLVIDFSAPLRYGAVAGAMTFTGVDQLTPLGTFAPASGNSAGPATVDVSSAANQLVFDTVACETCTSFTAGAGQTERWNLSMDAGNVMGAASTEPGAPTVTMSWSLGSADYWAIGAVPINPP